MATDPLPRDERRRRTESTILDAAREAFAEAGYERATIRAVAARAGVDPALVMQYFGSKDGLFAAAARWPKEHESALAAPREQLPAAALGDLFDRFEGDDREAVVALMRACLTHPAASTIMRDEVLCDRAAAVAERLEGDDVELRAALLGACLMGLGMARYLIEVPAVAGASRAELERLMAPVLAALVEPPT